MKQQDEREVLLSCLENNSNFEHLIGKRGMRFQMLEKICRIIIELRAMVIQWVKTASEGRDT